MNQRRNDHTGSADPHNRKRAVAYYRHSTVEKNESISTRRRYVQKYAAEHDIEIIKEFVDSGKPGHTTEDRDDFKTLMDYMAEGPDDFHAVLCHDATRWCRIRDFISEVCRVVDCGRHRKELVFTLICKGSQE